MHEHLEHAWNEGDDVPEMRDQPQVHDDLLPVLLAWNLLSRTKRDPLDPLRVGEVVAYLDTIGIMEVDLRLEYVELLTAMDKELRQFCRQAKADAEAEAQDD